MKDIKTICLTFSVLLSIGLNGQSDTLYSLEYLNKSTRFAWFTYGGDLNFLTGGTTEILNSGTKESIDFGVTIMPRLTIGGIHFWGHTDFYVTFPLSFLSLQNTPERIDELDVYQGVETGMRIYPLRLQPNRISPFAGISFRRMSYAQESEDSFGENGVPSYGRFFVPAQIGLTYTSDKWHISASGYYNFQNEFDYFISPAQQAAVQLNPLSFNLSLLRYVDSDRHMRTERAVERINEMYQTLERAGLLSSWFFGIGPSSALQIQQSAYLQRDFPYFYDNYSAAVLPDLSFGRYFNKPDANVNLTYRTYGDHYEGFDSEISIRRHSIGVESVKFFFDYLGFVPFVGPIASFESLHTTVNRVDYREQKLALGITFGWDIRVTKTGTSLLRTNLRYFPNLHMNIEGEKMMFNHLEFNFIQWVQFIGRKKALQ
ncbi:MAG: hypothetical protein KI786_02150 [Mameliella sp.]|nr:hypothetical protein [Phaeodactylibacter sp.]